MRSNAAKSFDILATSLSVLHNFDVFLNFSAKPFFPRSLLFYFKSLICPFLLLTCFIKSQLLKITVLKEILLKEAFKRLDYHFYVT